MRKYMKSWLALGTAAELMAQSSRERFEDAFVAIVKEAQR